MMAIISQKEDTEPVGGLAASGLTEQCSEDKKGEQSEGTAHDDWLIENYRVDWSLFLLIDRIHLDRLISQLILSNQPIIELSINKRSQMIILHAGFVDDQLLIWGETTLHDEGISSKKKKKASTDLPPFSPFNPPIQHFSDAFWEADFSFDAETTLTVIAWLPSTSNKPQPSSPILTDEGIVAEKNIAINPWQVTAIPLTKTQTVEFLSACAEKSMLVPGIVIGNDLRFWAQAFRFAAALVAQEQFLPGLKKKGDTFYASWQPVIRGEDTNRLAMLANAMPFACRALSFSIEDKPQTAATAILNRFTHQLVDQLVRSAWQISQASSPAPHTHMPACTINGFTPCVHRMD